MQLARECLLWLDAAPWRYWMLAWTAFASVAALAVLPAHAAAGSRWRNPWLFAGGVLLCLCAWRWPAWFYPQDLNPDEAQIVAGALTLERFHVYWKFVDGTSHGPLLEYPLVLASWLGAPFNYVSARVVAVLFQTGALLALWRALRRLTGEHVARTAILPGLAFWSFVSWDDFSHYSSELPGIFLLAAALWMLASAALGPDSPGRRRCQLWFCGLLLGLVPYAKLQSAPQAIATAAVAVAAIWLRSSPRREALVDTAWLIAGGLTPTAGLAVFLWVYGLWGQFWASYILSGMAYAEVAAHPLSQMPGRFFVFSATSPAFAWFFWGGLAFALLHARATPSTPATRFSQYVAWGLLAVAFFCVIRPGRDVAHYLHLLVMPLTAVAGLALAVVATSGPAQPAGPPLVRYRVWIWFFVLTLLPQAYDRAASWHRFVGYLREHLEHPRSEAARLILGRAQPGDTMAMWGWEPHLLVETGLPHGTREAHTSSQLTPWSMQHFFTVRYLADMERRQPAWFVDAVGPGAFIYISRTGDAHERAPGLARLVASHYEFVAELKNLRIYRRKPTGNTP